MDDVFEVAFFFGQTVESCEETTADVRRIQLEVEVNLSSSCGKLKK